MVDDHGFSARVGALALALGTGVASVHGCGIAAAGLDAGAMAAPAGDSLLSAVELLALSYADYYSNPWIVAETAMERGLGSMYINQYFSLSPANMAGYDYNATITQQPVFPSVVTGDYGQSDAYLVAWSPIGANAEITGVWKMDVGVPIAEQIGYGHDVVFFDRGFYPQIFSQIPGFTPELGDHAFPGNPTDPTGPGGTGPGDLNWDDPTYSTKWGDPTAYQDPNLYSHDVAVGSGAQTYAVLTGSDPHSSDVGNKVVDAILSATPIGKGQDIGDDAAKIWGHWQEQIDGDYGWRPSTHIFLESTSIELYAASAVSGTVVAGVVSPVLGPEIGIPAGVLASAGIAELGHFTDWMDGLFS